MSDWKPEVGQEYLTTVGLAELMLPEKDSEGFWLVRLYNGAYRRVRDINPIQTEADKQREEQITRMSANILDSYPRESAEALYDLGCRIIAPDEYVVKALTDEQLQRLIFRSSVSYEDAKWLIDAVQSELGIEVWYG